ncbi:DUF3221 domain-containing protein [Paenibacillus xylanivorans]|uniref:DUF3221 domain-containing protein n=1 Tax=Paenibacillus xylanivorans TaxID=1705561 RepID=A0A0M9BKT4_9BACL|nr:DUF3221 domain-containing protein [Paenibacillus xylanivorans]KOY14298.1 hypothetical protein AMS66_20035 [Paenibacillus xylanivorans]
MKLSKILLICFTLCLLSACTISNSGSQRIQGSVKEIDQHNDRILVVSGLISDDLDEDTNKLIKSNKYSEVYWVSGVNISQFAIGDEIEIFYDNLETSYPGILTAKKVNKLVNE